MESIDDDEVTIMLVNLSKQDSTKRAKAIIKENGLEAVAYYDMNGEFMKHFSIPGVPTAFYINESGHVKVKSIGGDNASGILKKINE